MSNYLAVGTVTATLRRMLQRRLDQDVPGAQATVDRPGSKTPGTVGAPGVNVFLYQVSPSAAFRAADLPTRRTDGSLITRPTIGLDLHYLLTFVGDETKLEPQRVLGSVVTALHAQPVITDAMIEAVKAAAAPPGGTPPVYPELRDSDLGEQVDAVRFTPAALNLEELSKLWSVFFQSPYQLSMAYHASVVLIEDAERPEPSRPVLRRGIAAEALGRPLIQQIGATPDPDEPITAASNVTVRGRDLLSDGVRVRVFGADLAPTGATGTEVTVDLSAVAPASLRAGERTLQIVRLTAIGDPPVPHATAVSQPALFVMHPRVQSTTVEGAPPDQRARLTLDVTVGARQSTALLLLDPVTAEQRFLFGGPVRAVDGSVVEIPIAGVAAGTYLVQVLVDGAESPLTLDAGGNPTEPTVTVP